MPWLQHNQSPKRQEIIYSLSPFSRQSCRMQKSTIQIASKGPIAEAQSSHEYARSLQILLLREDRLSVYSGQTLWPFLPQNRVPLQSVKESWQSIFEFIPKTYSIRFGEHYRLRTAVRTRNAISSVMLFTNWRVRFTVVASMTG